MILYNASSIVKPFYRCGWETVQASSNWSKQSFSSRLISSSMLSLGMAGSNYETLACLRRALLHRV